jgi:hypothetical protein
MVGRSRSLLTEPSEEYALQHYGRITHGRSHAAMSEEELAGDPIYLQLTVMRCHLEREKAQNELNQAIRAYLKLKKHLRRSRGEV